VTTDSLAQVLERRDGSDNEVCCCLMDVKKLDSWEGIRIVISTVFTFVLGSPKMLWIGVLK
jgi:hypothetical protein